MTKIRISIITIGENRTYTRATPNSGGVVSRNYNGKFVFLVPLAYDRIQNSSGQGTIARCRAIVDELKKQNVSASQCIVVLTAGYTAQSISKPTVMHRQSLAEQMMVYLEPHLFRATFIVRSSAWGTQSEILEASKLIREHCERHDIPLWRCAILTSSNKMHLHGRVKLWWRQYMPSTIEVETCFLEADQSFKPWERIQEFGKLVRDFFRVAKQKEWIRIIKKEED